jgi:hypothetical protein
MNVGNAAALAARRDAINTARTHLAARRAPCVTSSFMSNG